MGKPYYIAKFWKYNRWPFLTQMMNLIFSRTCLKREKIIQNISSTMKQRIFSGLVSVAHLWQQSAPHWDCERVLSSQSRLVTHYGCIMITQHH